MKKGLSNHKLNGVTINQYLNKYYFYAAVAQIVREKLTMIVEKIKKHLSIAQTRFNQKAALNTIAQHQNKTLAVVIDALLCAINGNFTKEDRAAFARCEKIRNELLVDETVISYQIFDSDKTAMVKDICKKAASSEIECQLLYALSKNTANPIVLEIGTNVGVSGCYILDGIKNNAESFFMTMEGLPQLCKIAKERFSSIVPTTKFEIKQGLFDIIFPMVLEQEKKFNLLFIDGNHQKAATIDYFNRLKKKISSPAILVFDDINWSDGMKEAWHIIKQDPEVNFAIDLYRQGIIVIDNAETTKNVEFKLHLSY